MQGIRRYRRHVGSVSILTSIEVASTRRHTGKTYVCLGIKYRYEYTCVDVENTWTNYHTMIINFPSQKDSFNLSSVLKTFYAVISGLGNLIHRLLEPA